MLLSSGPGARGEAPGSIGFCRCLELCTGQSSSGVVRLTKDLDDSIEGAHVLLIEDIVDTGITLRYLIDHWSAAGQVPSGRGTA